MSHSPTITASYTAQTNSIVVIGIAPNMGGWFVASRTSVNLLNVLKVV